MRTLIIAALAAAGAGAAATPALAQTVEELTVYGQWNGRGEPPASLSRVIDIRDLDLRLPGDRAELRHRVRDTARSLCDELGEGHSSGGVLGRSCEDQAVRGALQQVRIAEADAIYAPGPAYAAAVPPPAPLVDEDEAYVAPLASSADSYGAEASYRSETVTNGPVPDTPANRARLGEPMSNAGRQTAPRGN